MRNDARLIKTLIEFLASEDKQKGCQPIDQLQTIRHLLQPEAYLSRGTLAVQCGVSESTIYESNQRLQQFGWIEVEKAKNQFRPNRVVVLVDNLPLSKDLQRAIVSDAARQMAARYQMAVKEIDPSHRFKKTSLQSFAFRIQTLIDKCDGDVERVRGILNFAKRRDGYYVKKFLRGPHELRKCWKSLSRDYDAYLAQQSQHVATAQGTAA